MKLESNSITYSTISVMILSPTNQTRLSIYFSKLIYQAGTIGACCTDQIHYNGLFYQASAQQGGTIDIAHLRAHFLFQL
jgi:hypothetical protein